MRGDEERAGGGVCFLVQASAVWLRYSPRTMLARNVDAFGEVGPQPEVWVPLQVEPSMTDTVRSLRFPTKTVLVSNTIPTERGSEPTGIVAGVCPQPELSVALQCRALNTETVLSSVFAT